METNFEKYLKEIEIKLSNEKLNKFFLYRKLLKEWNEKINLTTIVDDNEILIKHFLDSLTIEKYIPIGASLIDVGTGAGFPGIPLKIIRDDINVILLDSLNKRINFLNEVIEKCDLKGIETVHGRAEDLAQDKRYREKFDIATARAVANLSTLSELCSPFIKVGGIFISMKAEAEEEFMEAKNALKILKLNMEKVDKFLLPEVNANRTVFVFKKIDKTPNIYPRKAGTPAKNPIS